MFSNIIKSNRSYRRFDESFQISDTLLKELVDFARLSPSAANLQPLKYITCCNKEHNQQIYQTLNWAAYLKNWNGPDEGERPSAYIIMLHDNKIKKALNFDQGIAAQSIMLGAVSKELGGCMIASFSQKKLRAILNIPEHLEILLVLAIGKPKEVVQIDNIIENDVKYWRDQQNIHHVPKRTINEILVKEIK